MDNPTSAGEEVKCKWCGLRLYWNEYGPWNKAAWFHHGNNLRECFSIPRYAEPASPPPANSAREQIADIGRKAGFHVTKCNYICQEVNVETLQKFGDLFATEQTRQLRESVDTLQFEKECWQSQKRVYDNLVRKIQAAVNAAFGEGNRDSDFDVLDGGVRQIWQRAQAAEAEREKQTAEIERLRKVLASVGKFRIPA